MEQNNKVLTKELFIIKSKDKIKEIRQDLNKYLTDLLNKSKAKTAYDVITKHLAYRIAAAETIAEYLEFQLEDEIDDHKDYNDISDLAKSILCIDNIFNVISEFELDSFDALPIHSWEDMSSWIDIAIEEYETQDKEELE